MTRRTPGPFLVLLLAAFLACAAFGGAVVLADEPAVPEAPGPVDESGDPEGPDAEGAGGAGAAEEDSGTTPADLHAWMRESPLALVLMIVLRYGTALLGLVLLALAWRRWNRRQAGLDPPLVPSSPTVPFRLPAAVVLFGASFLAVATLTEAVQCALPALRDSIVFRMSAGQLAFLLPGLVVIVRRYQLGARRPPSFGRVVPRAFRTVCVAAAFTVPAVFVTITVLQALGQPIKVYGPIGEFQAGAGTLVPWAIAFLAVVVAPIGEEAVFRGMFYPIGRSMLAGRRGGAIWAAVLVSALFAVMHMHAVSGLSLFVLALVLTWVFERTNSLLTVIVAHALWNLMSVLPLLLRSVG